MSTSDISKTRAEAVITVHACQTASYETPADGPSLTRIHVEEAFSGDIEGNGVVEFLQAARADGSASFVGIERVTGAVAGRTGSFLLQDSGTVTGSVVAGDWFVVPGSGRPANWPACAAKAASAPTSAKTPRSTSTTGSTERGQWRQPVRRGCHPRPVCCPCFLLPADPVGLFRRHAGRPVGCGL